MRASHLFLTACLTLALIMVASSSQSYAGVRGDLRVGLFTNGSDVTLGGGIIGGIAPNL
jgi:hypothetical protein